MLCLLLTELATWYKPFAYRLGGVNSEMLRIRDWSFAGIAGNSKYITKLRKPLLRYILLTLISIKCKPYHRVLEFPKKSHISVSKRSSLRSQSCKMYSTARYLDAQKLKSQLLPDSLVAFAFAPPISICLSVHCFFC